MTVADREATLDLRKLALQSYRAPFRYDRNTGFIFDADHKQVSDDGDLVGPENSLNHIIVRVRGWGFLQNLHKKVAAEVQDEIGMMIAEALTDFWNRQQGGSRGDEVKQQAESTTAGRP